jgi:hypothetical protein
MARRAFAEQSPQRLADTQPFPQGFDDQHCAEFHCAQDLEIVGQAAALSAFGASGVNNGNPTDSANGSGESNQGLPVELIGTTEAVDDTGYGGVGLRISLVVGELEILGNGAVLVFSFRGSQIHDCPPR